MLVGEYGDAGRQPRKNGELGSAVHIMSALVEHRAPGWDAGRNAEAEKTQAGFGNNDDGHGKRRNYGNVSESIRHDVLEENIKVLASQGLGRSNEVALL